MTKKELGQHWLFDDASLKAIIVMSEVDEDDCVLEIGPGLGTLTSELVSRANKVIAVEIDEELAENLPKRVQARNLHVIKQDILRFDLTQLPPDYRVVANIPYYLTSNLIRLMSESSNPPKSLTLLIQKEVAERLAAEPGSMSLLSVSAQTFFQTELGPIVKSELFKPPPKVDSQVIHLKRRPRPLYENADPKLFFRIIKAGFSNRRKTLLNSLSAGMHLSKPEVEKWLAEAGVSPQKRPQEIKIAQWVKMANSTPD